MMLLRNDSDEEVVIEGISLAYKDVGLSGFARPPSGTSWSIVRHNGKQICWQPPTDPVSTLRLLEPGLSSGTAIPIETILRCRIRGKPRLLRGKQIVTAGYINHRLTPFGP